MFWTEKDDEKTVLAEINLMKSDKEINNDFNIWLAQTRERQELSSPSRKRIRKNHVKEMTDKLTRTLALAYIDFRIIEFHLREKKSDNFFFDIASLVSVPGVPYKFTTASEEQIKDVVRYAMSTDFIRQLSEQATSPSAQD